MSDDNEKLLPDCPFCGSSNIDPKGCASFKPEFRTGDMTWDKDATPDRIQHAPACNNCGATCDIWSTRAAPETCSTGKLTDKLYVSDDAEHLQWIFDRLVSQHGENANYDYMLRFGKIIAALETPKASDADSVRVVREAHRVVLQGGVFQLTDEDGKPNEYFHAYHEAVTKYLSASENLVDRGEIVAELEGMRVEHNETMSGEDCNKRDGYNNGLDAAIKAANGEV